MRLFVTTTRVSHRPHSGPRTNNAKAVYGSIVWAGASNSYLSRYRCGTRSKTRMPATLSSKNEMVNLLVA